MIYILIALIALICIITITSFWLISQSNLKYKEKVKTSIQSIFEEKEFDCLMSLVVNKHITLALNNNATTLAIIEHFDPDNFTYNYREISTFYITGIVRNGHKITINYFKKGEGGALATMEATKEAMEFVHNAYKEILLQKIQSKSPNFKFDLYATSDWNCSYFWAYDSQKTAFATFNTIEQTLNIINLRKNLFTIDLIYNYLELPIAGENMQLLLYENDFLPELFNNLYSSIKQFITPATQDYIYYDNLNEIIYLSNSVTSLQSILIDNVEEIYYQSNKINFTLKNSIKSINFIADEDLIKATEEFVIDYNLRKIANSFNLMTDKIINANLNTKFIVDTTRDRIVYCANLNKFKSFSFMTIAFNNLKSADVLTSGTTHFVRIKTKDSETYDVTCAKNEVAQYIKAQIDVISAEL